MFAPASRPSGCSARGPGRRGTHPDQDIASRLVELLLAGARDLGGLLIFSFAALAVMLVAGGEGRLMPAVLLTYRVPWSSSAW